MKKIFILAVGGLFLSDFSFAQNEVDALRYSQLNFGGTARFTAMSGAFGALGGDFSVLSTNPAGIAIYRRSEFAFTPGFFSQKTTSDFKGNMLDDYKYNVNFSNAGIILAHYESETKKAWKGIMFGFGYNRLNNFNSRISMTGKNNSNSLLDIYVSDATNVGGDTNSMDQFGTQLALYSNAIWADSNGIFYHHMQGSYGEDQNKSVTTSGAMGETVFTLGGNYDDRLYLGATIGIPNIRYNEESNYQEEGDTNSLNGFKSFELNQDLRTTGVGFNFKFGMIYKPADWVRVGGALHSPTYFTMHDDWSSDMITHFSDSMGTYDFTSSSPAGLYDYTLVTPMRVTGSIGFVINKIGLIGADYEFVDYPSATLSSDKYKYLNENKAIRAKYIEGNNIRVGTEWKLAPMSIRAGAAYYGSPFKGETKTGSRIDYSGGIGFRDESFFLDIAYVYSQYSENYYFYDASVTSPSKNTSKSSSVMMTLGFKF